MKQEKEKNFYLTMLQINIAFLTPLMHLWNEKCVNRTNVMEKNQLSFQSDEACIKTCLFSKSCFLTGINMLLVTRTKCGYVVDEKPTVYIIKCT